MLAQMSSKLEFMACLLQLIPQFSQYFLFPPICIHVMGMGNF